MQTIYEHTKYAKIAKTKCRHHIKKLEQASLNLNAIVLLQQKFYLTRKTIANKTRYKSEKTFPTEQVHVFCNSNLITLATRENFVGKEI